MEAKNKFLGFFKNKNNVFIVVSFILAILAIILFIATPSIIIELNETGKGVVTKDPTSPIAGYSYTINGLNLLFGIGSYDVWRYPDSGKTIALVSEKLHLNIPLLVSVILLILSAIGILVLAILKKNNVLNKICFAGLVIGAILMLLSPIWFYAMNDIKSSLYTEIGASHSKYTPYELVNAHSLPGAVVASLIAIASSVFTGLTIKFKD